MLIAISFLKRICENVYENKYEIENFKTKKKYGNIISLFYVSMLL